MKAEIEQAVRYLKQGKTILYPTDTIWGIGCDATNPKAVKKILKLKKRSGQKSFIVLLDDAGKLKDYVEKVPSTVYDLLQAIETPLTIIYPNAINLPDTVMGEDRTVAIRIPKDPFCQQLIAEFGKPIVSSSANISGEATPILFNQISDSVKDQVDYIVDYNRDVLVASKASTIIKMDDNGDYQIIRN